MTHRQVIQALLNMISDPKRRDGSFETLFYMYCKSATREDVERIKNMTFQQFWTDFERDQ